MSRERKRKRILKENSWAILVYCPEIVSSPVPLCSDCWVQRRADVYGKLRLCTGKKPKGLRGVYRSRPITRLRGIDIGPVLHDDYPVDTETTREEVAEEEAKLVMERPKSCPIDDTARFILSGLIGFLVGLSVSVIVTRLPDWAWDLLEEALFKRKPKRRRGISRLRGLGV